MNIIADCHTHTIFSGHAYSTLEENIAEAKLCGLKILASTDHSPSTPGVAYKGGVVNQSLRPPITDGIHVLNGIEADVLNVNGDLDIEERHYGRFEIVVASMHPWSFDPKEPQVQTNTYLNVIKNGKADIIGHCGRVSCDYDIETVVKAAKEYNVAIELNNATIKAGEALGLGVCVKRCYEIAKACAKVGTPVMIDSDAHFCKYIGRFDNAIAMALECGIKEEQVINADLERFYDFMINKRGRKLRARL